MGDSYQKGIGVAHNRRLSQEWYWRAVLIGSANAARDLTTKGIMEREFMATLEMFQNLTQHGEQIRGKSVQMQGPNLASLLYMFHEQLKGNDDKPRNILIPFLCILLSLLLFLSLSLLCSDSF